MSPILEGQPAPDITAKDDQGRTINLKDFQGKQNLVLYFYPKDDTPGCTIEACNFRDAYSEYKTQDIQIFGVSYDDADSHQAFKKKFNLPFPLLVDSDKKIAQAFEVKGDKYASRDTILIDKQGRILKIMRGVDPAKHSAEVLATFQGK